MSETMPDIVTIREAASYLRVSISTIRRLITAGKLPASKVGQQYRIRREDLDAFFRKRRPRAPE